MYHYAHIGNHNVLFDPVGEKEARLFLLPLEGENSRLCHYLARLHRKTFCYSKSKEILFLSIKLLIFGYH